MEEAKNTRRLPSDPDCDVIDNPGIGWGGPIKEQGRRWQDRLKRLGGLGEPTPQTFKTFDFFDRNARIATSVKTLDTRAPGYVDRTSRIIATDHPEWDDVMRYPTPEEIKALEDADKARAGVKTLKALFNGAGHVSLRSQDGQIEIKPWRYRGRGHWEGIRGHDDTILPEDVPDDVFGKAILDALDISRNA